MWFSPRQQLKRVKVINSCDRLRSQCEECTHKNIFIAVQHFSESVGIDVFVKQSFRLWIHFIASANYQIADEILWHFMIVAVAVSLLSRLHFARNTTQSWFADVFVQIVQIYLDSKLHLYSRHRTINFVFSTSAKLAQKTSNDTTTSSSNSDCIVIITLMRGWSNVRNTVVQVHFAISKYTSSKHTMRFVGAVKLWNNVSISIISPSKM